MDLKYIGSLNPVIEGKILKKGMSFTCLMKVGERLLAKFPREYILDTEKAERSAKVREKAKKEALKIKEAAEVKNKMKKPSKKK